MINQDRITNVVAMNQKELYAAAAKAQMASANVSDVRPANGCGRVYVTVGYKTINKNSKATKTLESVGFRMTRRPYNSGLHIYVGYDNASGRELAMGEAIAQSFRESGIAAFADADAD